MSRGGAGVADGGIASQPAASVRDSELPSSALLEKARGGDPDAFMELLAPHRPRLESLACRLLNGHGDVPDVLQEVYLSAYRALPRYRGDAALPTWLYRITYNACLAWQGRRPRLAEQPQQREPAVPDHAGATVERLDLADALARLPIDQRALVLMVDRDGFDYRAAADALAIPLGTVSSRLAAARAKLRKALAPEQTEGKA